MDYGQILPSAIPHITNVEENINMAFEKYLFSLLVEIMFALLVIPFLVFSVYFVAKNVDRQKIDHIQDTTAEFYRFKKNHEEKKDDNLSIDQNIFSLKTIKQPQNKKILSLSQENTQIIINIDRKFNYFVTFTIINAISINAFDASYIVIGLLGLQITLYLALNACSCFSKFKILNALYILPTLATIVPYAIGNHSLSEL